MIHSITPILRIAHFPGLLLMQIALLIFHLGILMMPADSPIRTFANGRRAATTEKYEIILSDTFGAKITPRMMFAAAILTIAAAALLVPDVWRLIH